MFEDNIKIYDHIENAIKSNKNFIYLKKSIDLVEIFPFKKLYGVICDIGDNLIVDSGIPNELINSIDMSIYTPNALYKENEDIAYLSPNGYDTKERVLAIIKLFNMLSSINITIYTTHDIHFYVKSFSNSNITFFCYKNLKEVTISTSMIITYGYCARRFVQQKIPTIIIGSYGFGGWVTPDNIEYLLNDNFKGRPNGMYNELTPIEILVDEIMEIKESKIIKEYLDENDLILKNYLNNFSLKGFDVEIDQIKNFYNNFNNTYERQFLKPKLASNIRIINNGNSTLIQHERINNLLFSLPNNELDLLEDLNGESTCQYLQEKYEMNTEEFWNVMTPLWEQKAIVFI